MSREQECNPEGEVGDARLDERDRRLPLPQTGDDAGVDVVGPELAPALVSVDEEHGRATGQAREKPGDDEEAGDHDQAPEGRVDRRRLGEELGQAVHSGRSRRG
jgi:hypothetical protein